MNNKKLGNSFEHEFCVLAAKNGFWAHKMQDNKNGQPADIIMVKNNTPVLIDCKVCETKMFSLSRMEENQVNAMNKWITTGNVHAYFALKVGDLIFMICFKELIRLKSKGIKRLNTVEIATKGVLFDEWKEIFS